MFTDDFKGLKFKHREAIFGGGLNYIPHKKNPRKRRLFQEFNKVFDIDRNF